MLIKMLGIRAVQLVRFLRVKRKDVPRLTTGRSAYDWRANRNPLRSPVVWALGWDRATGPRGAAQLLVRWLRDCPDFVQPQLCVPREALAQRAASGALGPPNQGCLCRTDHCAVPDLAGRQNQNRQAVQQVGAERLGGRRQKTTPRGRKAAARASFRDARAGSTTGAAEGAHPGEGCIRGARPDCRAGFPGRDRHWALQTVHASMGSARDRAFCTQGMSLRVPTQECRHPRGGGGPLGAAEGLGGQEKQVRTVNARPGQPMEQAGIQGRVCIWFIRDPPAAGT